MLKRTLMVVALSALSAIAVADGFDARTAAQRIIPLEDGGTVYVFEDGRMALENKYGIATYTSPGTPLRAKDGTEFNMIGNDVARLDELLKRGLRD